jgi:ElaB/YqjD/DUF883 family membrane-anchored ribosome-binding protein
MEGLQIDGTTHCVGTQDERPFQMAFFLFPMKEGERSLDIFKLFGEIAIKNENANKNIKEVTQLAEDARDKISRGFENIGKAATTMGKIIGGVFVGSGAIGGALVALTDNTMEYRTAMGKLEAAFTTSRHSAENAKGTYSALASVLGDTDVAVEASNHLAKLTSNQQELQTWTNICTGVFATFGDSLPIEGLTEAANETAKVGQVTGSLADALNWAGVSEDEFNKSLALCTTEQERQKLIMDTLNGIYDEASQKYQEVNADVIAANQAQEKYTSAMAEFGEKAQPIVNAVKDGLGDLLQAASKLVENMDFTAIEDTIDGAFSWLIDTVVPAVEGFFGFLTENKDEVIAAIVAVATGFLAWNVVTIVQGVISAIKAWKLATEGMTIAQKLLNIVMNANPLGIIITLIAAVTAAVIYLWNNSEKFRTFVQNMLNGIKSWITNAVETAEELIASLVATVTTKFQEIKDIIESKLNDAKAKFSEIWQSVKDIFSDAVDVGKQLVQDIMDGIEKSWNDLKEWFRDLWDGLFGNLSVDVEANGSSGGVDGSHASGLDYVPFDGYVAELHRGEMVVPASEASILRSGAANADVANILLMILDAVQEGNSKETVLKLNNREFGRAVRGVVNV